MDTAGEALCLILMVCMLQLPGYLDLLWLPAVGDFIASITVTVYLHFRSGWFVAF